jgi:soluble lytic murein transglycosylase-like protein
MTRMRQAVVVALVVLLLVVPPSRGLAHATLLCRGSARAQVHISWPTRSQAHAYTALHFGAHVPQRIRRWAYLFVPMARAAGLDPYVVAGLVRIESNGDPLAWNLDSDAHGLVQVLHASFEPSANLRAGIDMLHDLQQEFGRRDLVLAAYNAGPGAVLAYGGVPPYHETRDYVLMVQYWRAVYAGEHLSTTRTRAYNAALADLRAYHHRICGDI